MNTAELGETYGRDGVVSPVRIMGPDEARVHRRSLEWAENRLGPLHYRDKIHTILTSPWEIITNPRVLDCVEEFIGPDILVYNSTYVVKEPGSTAFVNWHQDLTYWGFADDDAQVSMWFALAPATEASGCMQMIPGSHRGGRLDHATGAVDDNILLLGQRIEDVDTGGARFHPLAPGEASFHHGWTVHNSPPNVSSDRRIGLNVQYIAPHNRQAAGRDASAIVVRGMDEHGFFGAEEPASADLEPRAVERWREAERRAKQNFMTER